MSPDRASPRGLASAWRAPAGEQLLARHLATAKPESIEAQNELLQDLAASPELFKIIVTSRPRGTIPANLWHSSYVIFLESLDEHRDPSR